MVRLTLRLLGPPCVLPPRGPVARRVGSGKNLALLAYLALESGPHRRAALAALLWGDSPERAARASLRQSVRQLRRVLRGALRVDRTTVELCGPVECDVTRFLAAAQSAPREAAAFDVPRFLAGFAVRRAPAFDEWVTAKRQSLLQRFVTLLGALAREAITRSQWREAGAWAERWLACEPLSEEAARLAIEALYLAGDRAAALERFREYRERRARELRSPPSIALQQLSDRVANDEGLDFERVTSDEVATPLPPLQASLVARETEWRQLVEALKAVKRGAGRVVLIEGEAGVGKTRLAGEFLRFALAEGATVLRGRGYDGKTGIPYDPVVQALRGALRAPGLAGTAPEWLGDVTRLLPELTQRFPGLVEAAAPAEASQRWRLFEGIAQLLLAVATERPTVLFIDDLQWCDSETCALVHFLMGRIERSHVALVATLTLGQLERSAPSARLARGLRSQPHAVVVTLRPLSETDVWAMIREMGRVKALAGGRRFAKRLHQVSDGNPFHVIELLKTLFARQLLAIKPATGEWVAVGATSAGSDHWLEMPPRVRAAVGERLAGLTYELRDLLATVAVAGNGVRTELLSHVHGMSRLRTAALADALVERHLLTEDGGRYRCAHPVIAEAVCDQLTPSRRRELHRAIALSLEAVTLPARIGDVAGEIAHHAERGEERAMAYRHALVASETAAARHAFADALSWLDLASSVAQPGVEADTVKRSTADLLKLAGWAEPHAAPMRAATSARGVEPEDLDLPAPEWSEQVEGVGPRVVVEPC